MTGQVEALLAGLLEYAARDYASKPTGLDRDVLELPDLAALSDAIRGSSLTTAETCPVCHEVGCDDDCPLLSYRGRVTVMLHLLPGEQVRIVDPDAVTWTVPRDFEGFVLVTREHGGTVRTLADDTDPQRALDGLTPVQSAVLAARLRTWATHLDGQLE